MSQGKLWSAHLGQTLNTLGLALGAQGSSSTITETQQKDVLSHGYTVSCFTHTLPPPAQEGVAAVLTHTLPPPAQEGVAAVLTHTLPPPAQEVWQQC